jgi:hypothetical protein
MTIPQTTFYVRIKPIRENQEPIVTRVKPDAVGEYIAGYTVYQHARSNKRAAYFRKYDFILLIENEEYVIIPKPDEKRNP